MHLVQMLLPIRDNDGNPFGEQLLERVRHELTEKFGGVTAYLRAPAHGAWHDGERVSSDDVIMVEVMCDELDRAWWTRYREALEKELRQQELMVRALPIETL